MDNVSNKVDIRFTNTHVSKTKFCKIFFFGFLVVTLRRSRKGSKLLTQNPYIYHEHQHQHRKH